MRSINAREARERFKELLDSAEHAEVVAITRRGQEVARLIPPAKAGGGRLPDLTAFRASIKVTGKPMKRKKFENVWASKTSQTGAVFRDVPAISR